MTAVAFRREVYLAAVITCLQRFESHLEISCSVFVVHSLDQFSFCDKTNIILWEKIWRKHYLTIKSTSEETEKKRSWLS